MVGQHSTNNTLLAVDAAVILIGNVVTFLSVAGCLVIISVYVAYKEIRTTSRLLLVFLSVADILVALSTLMQTGTYYNNVSFPNQSSYSCQATSFFYVFSQGCAALWTTATSFYLFLCVTGGCVTVANRIVFLFHIFCWGMPLLIAIAADVSGVYGYEVMDILLYQHPTPCWISSRVKNKLAWYLLTVEGWVMAAFVTVSLAYLSVTWTIIRQRNKGKVVTGENVIEELALQTANQQLRFIPVIYVCTRIWGTGYFLFTRYPENSHLRASDWLLVLKAFGDNSQGLANAIFFCLATQQIRSIMHKKLKICCACFSGWCRRHKIIGPERWTAVSSIVRMRKGQLPNRRSRNLDESDLDLSGISLELPPPGGDRVDNGTEDDVIFER